MRSGLRKLPSDKNGGKKMTEKNRQLKRLAKKYFACDYKFAAKHPSDWETAIMLTLVAAEWFRKQKIQDKITNAIRDSIIMGRGYLAIR